MVTPGAKVELSFTVKAVIDGKICEGPFADLLAGNTVVSVYMRNNTGSCDRQNAALIGIAAELKRGGRADDAASRMEREEMQGGRRQRSGEMQDMTGPRGGGRDAGSGMSGPRR